MARLIDADALAEKISDYMDIAHIQRVTRKSSRSRTLWSGIHGGVNYCRNLVFEAPTIEAAPVKYGQWNIKTEIYRYGMEEEIDEEFFLECSECGRRVWVSDNTKVLNGKEEEIFEDYPYCHCGAKMDGGAGT